MWDIKQFTEIILSWKPNSALGNKDITSKRRHELTFQEHESQLYSSSEFSSENRNPVQKDDLKIVFNRLGWQIAKVPVIIWNIKTERLIILLIKTAFVRDTKSPKRTDKMLYNVLSDF